MRQPLRYPWPNLDVDDRSEPIIAVRVDADGTSAEVPDHRHRKGQLVFSLGGGVTCRVPGGLWMAPPHSGVWIPSGMAHSNRATANARLFFVYIEAELVDLPERCCTISISPLLRELIVELSDHAPHNDARGELLRSVLLGELPRMPVQQLHLPLSTEPRLKRIAAALAENPADRRMLAQWADRVALSESSLARLVARETGLTFGRWRTAAPDRRNPGVGLRRERAARFGRSRLRIRDGIHHDVQKGAWEAASQVPQQCRAKDLVILAG